MSKYIRVVMVYEDKHIADEAQWFVRAIGKDFRAIFKAEQVAEPNAMTIEVLDMEEDDDATV